MFCAAVEGDTIALISKLIRLCIYSKKYNINFKMTCEFKKNKINKRVNFPISCEFPNIVLILKNIVFILQLSFISFSSALIHSRYPNARYHG